MAQSYPAKSLGTFARAWWKLPGRFSALGGHAFPPQQPAVTWRLAGRCLAVFVTDQSRKTLAALDLAAESTVCDMLLS